MYLDCASSGRDHDIWYNSTEVFKMCNFKTSEYNFGLFSEALKDEVPSATLVEKYFYCLWFGLRSLRFILYLVLFIFLIYLQINKIFIAQSHKF